MTAEQIVAAALAECEAVGWKWEEGSRLPMYQRISDRQQQLFSLAGQWDEDYAGWSVLGQVASGVTDFSSILTDDHPDVPGAERVTRIEISDPGSSDYAAHERINVVRADDGAYAALAPRATFRSGWLEQYGTDLAGVAQVRVYYVRRPRPVEEADDVPEIKPPHTDLLVLDLARWIVSSTEEVDPNVRASVLSGFDAREKDQLALFEAHVRGFAPTQDRFR